MQDALWEIDLKYDGLATLLEGVDGASRANLNKIANGKIHLTWHLAKCIIFWLQATPHHRRCMIWGYARDDLKQKGILEPSEESVENLANILLQDYEEFVNKALWRMK